MTPCKQMRVRELTRGEPSRLQWAQMELPSSEDVLTLTGCVPLSEQELARKNAATFTASAKAV